MDLKSRLQKIQMRHESFKHLRGKHDQLDHAWNRGMGRGNGGVGLAPGQMRPLPTQDFYRKRRVELVDQERRGEITNADLRRQLNMLQGKTQEPKKVSTSRKKPVPSVNSESLVLANRTTPLRATIAGQELYDAVNDPMVKPTRSLLSRFLMEYGYNIQMQETRKLDERQNRKGEKGKSVIDQKDVPELPYWAKGANFFSSAPRTTGVLSKEEVAKKPARWKNAYAFALMRLQKETKSSSDSMFQAAQDFADHINYLTGDESPYTDAANLIGIGMLSDVTQRLSEARGTANQFDVNAGAMHTLRRVLSFPLKFIKKYGFKVNAVQVSQEIENDFNTDTMMIGINGEQEAIDIGFDERGEAILEGMKKTDRESIFGYLADKFPEMQTYLFTVLTDGYRGGVDVPIDQKLVDGVIDAVRNGTTPNAEMFSTPTMIDDKGATVPFQPISAKETQPFDPDSGDWVIDSNGIPVPLSSVRLQQAIDPNGMKALMAAEGGRISINSAVAEQKHQLILDLAEETGIPPIVISSLLSYWQNGAQTIEGHPVPTLALLQKAAAEMFGLTLGFDGPLDPYQEQQIIISSEVLQGYSQPNAFYTKPKKKKQEVDEEDANLDTETDDKSGFKVQAKEERQNAENAHFYRDIFDPYAGLDVEGIFNEQVLYPFVRKTQSSTKLDEYQKMTEDEKKQKYTDKERETLDRQLKTREENNKRFKLSPTAVAPGAPYQNAEQARRALLKAVYNKTQQRLRDAGIKGATLYRTISLTMQQLKDLEDQYRERTGDKTFTVFGPDGSFDPEKVVGAMFDVPRNAMESWSTSHVTASALGANIEESLSYEKDPNTNHWRSTAHPIVGEIVVAGDFDVSRMISTPETGFGQFREGEVIIVGDKADRLKVVSAHRRGGRLQKIPAGGLSLQEIQSRYEQRLGLASSAYMDRIPGINAIVNKMREGIIQGKALARVYQMLLRSAQGRY